VTKIELEGASKRRLSKWPGKLTFDSNTVHVPRLDTRPRQSPPSCPHAHMCRSGCRNRSNHGGPPAPTARHTEPLSADAAVGATDHTRTGAGLRRQNEVVALVAVAQNGTSRRDPPVGPPVVNPMFGVRTHLARPVDLVVIGLLDR
jgi:hypothetical protein